jgi:hypothetical protein
VTEERYIITSCTSSEDERILSSELSTRALRKRDNAEMGRQISLSYKLANVDGRGFEPKSGLNKMPAWQTSKVRNLRRRPGP